MYWILSLIFNKWNILEVYIMYKIKLKCIIRWIDLVRKKDLLKSIEIRLKKINKN